MPKLASPSDRYPLLRRFAVLIVVAGGLAGYSFVKPHLPHDHPVAYRFEPEPSGVTDLEVTWTRPDAEDPVAGARYYFAPGTAPKELQAVVKAPDGTYTVELTVTAHGTRTTDRQLVQLEDRVARVRVPLSASSAPSAGAAAAPASAAPPASVAPSR
jgi:hypothetical protein